MGVTRRVLCIRYLRCAEGWETEKTQAHVAAEHSFGFGESERVLENGHTSLCQDRPALQSARQGLYGLSDAQADEQRPKQ